jgi:hypothetical protein
VATSRLYQSYPPDSRVGHVCNGKEGDNGSRYPNDATTGASEANSGSETMPIILRPKPVKVRKVELQEAER